MATDAGVAHAFAGERKAAFIERHKIRLLLARFDRFFRLLDYILVETRRHLLLRTLSHVHTVLMEAFDGANSIGTPSPFLQLRLELDLPEGEEAESPSSRQRQVTIAATPTTDDTKTTPSRASRADGAYASPERTPEPVLRLQPDSAEVYSRISDWLHSLETAIGVPPLFRKILYRKFSV